MEILKITNENFKEEVVDSEKTVIVDFYADWCMPCKMMAPTMEEIAKDNENIKVGKVNIDEAKELAQEYNVMSIPTIMIFKNGNILKEFVGVTSKEEILNAI